MKDQVKHMGLSRITVLVNTQGKKSSISKCTFPSSPVSSPPLLQSVYKHILFLVPTTAALGVVSSGTGKALHMLFKRTMSLNLIPTKEEVNIMRASASAKLHTKIATKAFVLKKNQGSEILLFDLQAVH